MEEKSLLTPLDVGMPFANQNGSEKIFVLRYTLARLVEKKGVTQTEVSLAVGIPHSTLGDWIHGVAPRGDSLPHILQLAEYFGVSFYYLCFGERSDQEAMHEEIKVLKFQKEKLEWELAQASRQLDMFRASRPA
jgi:transcriptional regulator with XRE-family HTH domain